MSGLSVADMLAFTVNGVVPVEPPPKVVHKREPYSMLSREWGKDTVMSKFYICTVLDETEKIAYLIGGLGTTERLVGELTEHKLKTYGEEAYRIVSKGQKASPGFGLDLSPWKKVVVIPGTGDFHFLLRNHRGRKAVIK